MHVCDECAQPVSGSDSNFTDGGGVLCVRCQLKIAANSTEIAVTKLEIIRALEPLIEEVALALAEDGDCDHSVGICMCNAIRAKARGTQVLARLKNDPSLIECDLCGEPTENFEPECKRCTALMGRED